MRGDKSGVIHAVANWLFGRKESPDTERVTMGRMVRARYDAATIDQHNERHWAMADGLSARQANTPDVRLRLRNHARYETANNCHARGMLNTLADLEIGFGAVIQLPKPAQSTVRERQAIKDVERLFEEWADAAQLWHKLWTARIAKAQDGEGCAIFRTNPNVDSAVQLDLQLIESEQISHGYFGEMLDPKFVDGVELDDVGNVIAYFVLPEHPGDALTLGLDPIRVPARQIIHWFRCDRPGQVRGIPEITPALPLFAQLRRFTLATLTAAETAADVVGVIKSNIVPEYDPDSATDSLNLIDMHRGMWMELPDGRDVGQIKAEHPMTTYQMFKTEILSEIGRCLQLPKAIALADASGYNYASGRLDRQAFDRYVETARWHCEQQALRKVWQAWWYEASRIAGYLPPGAVELLEGARPKWLWRVLGHVDREKEEKGRALALANHTTTLAEECGREGLWWEDVLEQRAAELNRLRELGLSAPPAQDAVNQGQGGEDDDDGEQSEERSSDNEQEAAA